jgi:hypothetical protein
MPSSLATSCSSCTVIICVDEDNRIALAIEVTFKQKRGIDDDGFDRCVMFNRFYDSRPPLRDQGVKQPFEPRLLGRVREHDFGDPGPVGPAVRGDDVAAPPFPEAGQHVGLAEHRVAELIRGDHLAALPRELRRDGRLARSDAPTQANYRLSPGHGADDPRVDAGRPRVRRSAGCRRVRKRARPTRFLHDRPRLVNPRAGS